MGHKPARASPIQQMDPALIMSQPEISPPVTGTAFPARTFSGIQPTGNLHLGNYLGAIMHWVRMQHDMPCVFCVVDLHAITVWQEPASMAQNTREMTAALLAAGVDPDKAILFAQSHVGAHAELAWMLSCTARYGWLNRMVQFKEKAGKHKERVSVGLWTYPVLQAADILLYKATHVPVGEDQRQHLELARDIAQKFNVDFGKELFPLPEATVQGPATRVMSLRDGNAKMSKSDPSDMSRINLRDDADTLRRKIQKARTDADVLPATTGELESRPEAQNLVGIFAALNDQTPQQVLNDYAGKGFGTFKPALADLVVARLEPVLQRFGQLIADPGHIDAVLRAGGQKAAELAAPTMAQVYEAVGFLPR